MKFKPTICESGYFLAINVEDCRNQIPDKYFVPNVNYEDDPDTKVLQVYFPATEEYKKVPLDFALCRYLAVEKGIAMMPMSNFCLPSSANKQTDFVRICICKWPDAFLNTDISTKFLSL